MRTKHSIGAELLNSMKDGALLVNTARGALIDEEALVSVLKERSVWAALDVYETEPLPMDSPLRDCERVLLMPHAAGPTADRRYAVTSYVLDDMERFMNGENLDSCVEIIGRRIQEELDSISTVQSKRSAINLIE